LYEDSWREPDANRDQTGGTDLRLARVYSRRLAASLGRKDFDGLRIVDFGAGTGTMSVALHELGAEVAAIDPFGFERLDEQGLDGYRSLDDLEPGALFDGAVCLDVIEHLPAPWAQLVAVRERLVPGGWLYVSTLNTSSLNARLTRAGWREARKPGHVVFFNARSLKLVLASAGFVDVSSPRWIVRYSRNPVRRVLQLGLQVTRLETGLRALALNGHQQ
jgi:2-polyprenyl-3-methyl-5-hydroxy-6-metoxy-1,4-benzoquinol methylase